MLALVRPSTEAEVATQSTLAPQKITQESIKDWKKPSFQRPLVDNKNLKKEVSLQKQNGGRVSGVITLGVLNIQTYLIDGQHRLEAFRRTELPQGFADVRTLYCKSMEEMAEEFSRLNGSIARMRPDDILRSLSVNNKALQDLEKRSNLIGYDRVRRSKKGPILSMNQTLRVMLGSKNEIPTNSGPPIKEVAESLTDKDVNDTVAFLKLCYEAWGRDKEYANLWLPLNLTLCAWLWRNTVIGAYNEATTVLRGPLFLKCLMSLSADTNYVSWLKSRLMREENRAPAYLKIRDTFASRLRAEGIKRPALPKPEWLKKQGL